MKERADDDDDDDDDDYNHDYDRSKLWCIVVQEDVPSGADRVWGTAPFFSMFFSSIG